ncbi:MAG: hypothetical protein NTV34_00400 [Proteobacteria bacterium]|nr:hypothetical protein [Pseudomonadota bacterium]
MKISVKSRKEFSDVSSSGFTVHFSQSCAACCGTSKSVRREFSDQAWSALVSWSEINSEAVDQPICNDCYFNLREVLIDRAEDISAVASAFLQGDPDARVMAVNC